MIKKLSKKFLNLNKFVQIIFGYNDSFVFSTNYPQLFPRLMDEDVKHEILEEQNNENIINQDLDPLESENQIKDSSELPENNKNEIKSKNFLQGWTLPLISSLIVMNLGYFIY